jgi:hypothetical protein
MKPHECRESKTCICRCDADEPNDDCPVHGCGEFPPRCGACGKFLPHVLCVPDGFENYHGDIHNDRTGFDGK